MGATEARLETKLVLWEMGGLGTIRWITTELSAAYAAIDGSRCGGNRVLCRLHYVGWCGEYFQHRHVELPDSAGCESLCDRGKIGAEATAVADVRGIPSRGGGICDFVNHFWELFISQTLRSQLPWLANGDDIVSNRQAVRRVFSHCQWWAVCDGKDQGKFWRRCDFNAGHDIGCVVVD